MKTVVQEKLDIEILKTSSPVLPQQAWQIESFCLKILEYCNYSLPKALSGKLSTQLQCTFFTARNNGNILATAGCLYSFYNPAVAILGPVCVSPEYRRNGFASKVCKFLISHLKAQDVKAIYLGVQQDNPALDLYRKLGFENYNGIVMRKLLVNKDEFSKRYSPLQAVTIRKILWCDFSEISALMCEPASIYSFDFCEQIFSAKYTETKKFLPVFPNLMNSIEKKGGYGFVLQTKECLSITGIAFIKLPSSTIQNHIAFLDFFVLDRFLDKGNELVSKTIKESGFNGNRTILCYCSEDDIHKKKILLSLGAEPYATLPDFIRINDKFQDTIIYKFTRRL